MLLVLALLCCSVWSHSFSASKRARKPYGCTGCQGSLSSRPEAGDAFVTCAELSGFASRLSPSPEVAFKSCFLLATEAKFQMCFHCIGRLYVWRVQLVKFCLIITALFLHIHMACPPPCSETRTFKWPGNFPGKVST